MSNPNFVNDLVMMAKAYEELPGVKQELSTAQNELADAWGTIQRLELKLIERANEIDALNAKVRTVEVERDHAETMFLETDDKLNALRRVIAGFTAEVSALGKASEPQAEVKVGASEEDVMSQPHEAAPVPYEPKPDADVIEALGQREPDPTPDAVASDAFGLTPADTQADASGVAEGVSVSADPTPESDTSHASATSPEHSAPITPLQVSPMDGGDDVGYHNEPDIASPDWELWFDRMTARYGHRASWPERDYTTTRPINSQT